MQTYNYQKITCKSALNRINSKFLPYHYDLNIYRGCSHNCVYCYAQYTHTYLEDSDFFKSIYVKENVVQQLEKELQSKNWKHDVINLGGVTDSYQACEEEYKIMPEILKLLIKYKTPAIISTKSSLIVRDVELLKELSSVAGVQIAFTITTLDQKIADKIEPGASLIKDRLKAMKQLKDAGLTIGWHLMPIIPYITATRNNLTAIFKTAQQYKIDYMILGILNLRGITRKTFFNFAKESYPEFYEFLWKLYHDSITKIDYKKGLNELLNNLTKEYQICRNYYKFVPKVDSNKQLTLPL